MNGGSGPRVTYGLQLPTTLDTEKWKTSITLAGGPYPGDSHRFFSYCVFCSFFQYCFETNWAKTATHYFCQKTHKHKCFDLKKSCWQRYLNTFY
jgi:hypothetical protein